MCSARQQPRLQVGPSITQLFREPSVTLLLQEPSGSHPQGIGEQHLQDKEPLKSVYSVVHKPGQAMKMI